MHLNNVMNHILTIFALNSETWMAIIMGAIVSFVIAYLIYHKQKKETIIHKQEHDSRFDELKQLHQQDSEKIQVLYDLIVQTQKSNIGEVESAVLEQRIVLAADNITEQDSDQAQALKAIAGKQKDEADDLLDKIAQREHDLVEVYDLRAMNEYRNGEYTEAIKWYRKILELEPDNFPVLINLIKSLDGADLRVEARELAMKKLEALEKEGLTADRKTYEMVNMIVFAYNFEFETEEAEPWVFKLLELTKQLYPGQSLEMVRVYNALGDLYASKQHYKESEEAYLQAMTFGESDDEEARNEVNNTLNNLALLYSNTGRFKEALPLMEQNIRYMNAALGEGHPESFYSLINQAYATAHSDSPELAEGLYLKVKDMIEKKLGKDHDKYFKVMQHLAGLTLEKERFDEAEVYIRENLERQIARKGDSSFEVAVLLRCLCQALAPQGKIEEAETVIRRSVDLFRKVAPPESVQGLAARQVLTHLNIEKGNYDEARQDLLQMIEILHNLGRDTSGNMATYQNYLLEIYLRQEQWSEAEEFLSKIISAYDGQGAHGKRYVILLQKYSQVLEKLGRQEEAQAFTAKAVELAEIKN